LDFGADQYPAVGHHRRYAQINDCSTVRREVADPLDLLYSSMHIAVEQNTRRTKRAPGVTVRAG
jgi:hypothetical protein